MDSIASLSSAFHQFNKCISSPAILTLTKILQLQLLLITSIGVMIKTMDVRAAASTMAKASGAVHATESLCGLLPINTKLGRSGCNSQIQYTIFRRRASVKAANPSGNQSGSGDPNSVDAEMIVLRKRIQELRMQETKYAPPRHWMKWEKEWSVTYASDICQFLGCLQNILINTRPAIPIAALALISLTVPGFVVLLLFQVFQFSAPLLTLAKEFLTKLLNA